MKEDFTPGQLVEGIYGNLYEFTTYLTPDSIGADCIVKSNKNGVYLITRSGNLTPVGFKVGKKYTSAAVTAATNVYFEVVDKRDGKVLAWFYEEGVPRSSHSCYEKDFHYYKEVP